MGLTSVTSEGRGFRKLEVADRIDPEGGVNVAVFFSLFFSAFIFPPEGVRRDIARLGPTSVLTVLSA